jgi:hypothetical protein
MDQSPKWSPDGRQIAFVRVVHKQSSTTREHHGRALAWWGGARDSQRRSQVRLFAGYSLLDWFKIPSISLWPMRRRTLPPCSL